MRTEPSDCWSCQKILTVVLLCLLPWLAASSETVSSLPPRDAPPNAHAGFLGDGPIYEIDPWAMSPEGDLAGITKRIPYIADLGIKTIYIMPLFKHEPFIPYRVYDFFQLDPGFGTDEDLRALVRTAHEHGLRVLLDLIVSHTPPDGLWTVFPNDDEIENIRRSGATERLQQALARRKIIDDAYASGTAFKRRFEVGIPMYGITAGAEYEFAPTVQPFYEAHPEFFRHDANGNPLRTWPVEVWGYAPDYDHVGYQNYIADVAWFWIKKYDIDGWRVDAPQNNWDPKVFPEAKDASELLRKVKAAMIRVKPDAVLLSERMAPNYGGGAGEGNKPLFDEMAEASYQDHILWFLSRAFSPDSGVTLPTAEKLNEWLSLWPVWYGRGRAHVLETHDFSRIAQVAPEFVRPLAVLQFTLPGIPMLFCGQEIGETDRYLVHWNRVDHELLTLYKKLCHLYTTEPTLRLGRFQATDTGNPDLCVYGRSSDGAYFLVALNWGNGEETISVNLTEPLGISNKRVRMQEPLVDDPEWREMNAAEPLVVAIPARGFSVLQFER